jgi:hypothetical protein
MSITQDAVSESRRKSGWITPAFSVVDVTQVDSFDSKSQLGLDPPSPLAPPLMMKDTGDTDSTQPGGTNTKPGGSADFGVKDWGP